jgi:hypothetical protein
LKFRYPFDVHRFELYFGGNDGEQAVFPKEEFAEDAHEAVFLPFAMPGVDEKLASHVVDPLPLLEQYDEGLPY